MIDIHCNFQFFVLLNATNLQGVLGSERPLNVHSTNMHSTYVIYSSALIIMVQM